MAAAEVMFTRGRFSATLLTGCWSARVAVGVASPPLSRELLLGECCILTCPITALPQRSPKWWHLCLLAAGCGRRCLTLLASSGPLTAHRAWRSLRLLTADCGLLNWRYLRLPIADCDSVRTQCSALSAPLYVAVCDSFTGTGSAPSNSLAGRQAVLQRKLPLQSP